MAVSHSLPGGHFKNTYELLLNLTALKFSPVNKIHIFQCMSKIFCMEFQRYPLKFHTKCLTHTSKLYKNHIFQFHWKIWFLYNFEILRALRFKSSYTFLKRPPGPMMTKISDVILYGDPITRPHWVHIIFAHFCSFGHLSRWTNPCMIKSPHNSSVRKW